MKNSYINLLLLGQTGSCKTSLLNYLAGEKIAETGDGLPVTPEGEFEKFEFALPDAPQVICRVYDSWGLETNKAGRWDSVISSKLNSSLDWKDIIGGIIFCISYVEGRVQPYEEEYIKSLLAQNYRVIIAFTKADSVDRETYHQKWREDIQELAGNKKNNISFVDICTIDSDPKLGEENKPPIHPFGKEELLELLKEDMSLNIANVFSAKVTAWRKNSISQLEQLKATYLAKIEEGIGTFTTDDEARQLQQKFDQELANCVAEIQQRVKNLWPRKTLSYYEELFPEVKTTWVHVIVGLILLPVVLPAAYFAAKEDRKKFSAYVEKQIAPFISEIKNIEKEIKGEVAVFKNAHQK